MLLVAAINTDLFSSSFSQMHHTHKVNTACNHASFHQDFCAIDHLSCTHLMQVATPNAPPPSLLLLAAMGSRTVAGQRQVLLAEHSAHLLLLVTATSLHVQSATEWRTGLLLDLAQEVWAYLLPALWRQAEVFQLLAHCASHGAEECVHHTKVSASGIWHGYILHAAVTCISQ